MELIYLIHKYDLVKGQNCYILNEDIQFLWQFFHEAVICEAVALSLVSSLLRACIRLFLDFLSVSMVCLPLLH